MSRPSRNWLVVAAAVGLAAVLPLSCGRPPARPGQPAGRPVAVGPPVAAGSSTPVGRPTTTPVAAAPAAVQVDPESIDPGLGGELRRDLAARPLFQHLPYRDREIGVGFDRVVGGGRLELLVSYVGSRRGAELDVGRLLARYKDPGTAYVERYQRVS